ncbi:hypothetical protein PR202_gb23155 [Eleusine coracana subsp. coracana]|uniref:Uncharacterized protein n=1 Tax=Eleusine coracana subsp. coracana TaxID=191504 RepID=A0AAV5FI25_ELECO|nr:hypothetical protein PR202_gb23155 [Eleusine coracana subsp. coracana]
MESALRSLTKTPKFPQPPAVHHQPPLLPLPAQAPSPQQHSFWPAPRANKMMAHPGPSAPITVAAPSKKRVAPATHGDVEWTGTESPYSVSPSPSCVPMPTSLLATVAAARTACAVEVAAGAAAGVDVGATDELRRLLRL